MQGVLDTIFKLSDKDEDLNKLLQKLKGNQKVIKRNTNQIDATMGMLDPTKHTLGMLYLLSFKCGDVKDHNQFITHARKLMIEGDGHQLKMIPKKMTQVCEQFKLSLILTESFMNGVLPLKKAVEKMRGAKKKYLLTSIHHIFLLVCLKAHCYRQALDILKAPVYEIDPKNDGMKPIDYLSFQFYAGNIYCGVKQFDKAIERYQMALTMPSNVISQIQIESYKRYILCCLLVHGNVVPLPQGTTSHVVHRCVDKMVVAYTELASAFKKDVSAVRRVVAEQNEIFLNDKNYGLVNQVLVALIKRNIKRLTNTYVILSLREIAETAELSGGAEEAEKHVRNMITEGSINARINQRDGMLKFLEDKEDYASTLMLMKLDTKIQQVISLSEKLSLVNKDILLNPLYIQKTIPRDRDEFKSASTGSMLGRGGGHEREDRDLQMAMEQSLRDVQ